MTIETLSPHLWRIEDTCNVYVLRDGDRGIAIDFGSGAWRSELAALGIARLEHVFLTHHHADQCAGLATARPPETMVHAPAGEEAFLDPERLRRGRFDPRLRGCPASYAVLPGGLDDLVYDLAGFTDRFWGRRRLRLLHTPGHGPNAVSLVADIDGKQVVFCGDAAHAGATIHQPWHLEWDHWTGGGALAAWEGAIRLRDIGCDLLCPAHGPVVDRQPRALLTDLARRLLRFYAVKGQIAPGEPDAYLDPEPLGDETFALLPGLFAFGMNGYLLVSAGGDALLFDPTVGDLPALEALLARRPGVRIAALTATHYHHDHCDAIPALRARFGASAFLHPRVAEPLAEGFALTVPWLPEAPIPADAPLPERGVWRWNEFSFTVAPAPGQTWWHAQFLAEIAGRKVAFIGDSFQPPSRWNGTGGFCAFNRSRFDGFAQSAGTLLAWRPDWLLAGHQTFCQFRPRRFAKIGAWAARADAATRALCPAGDLERDYYAPAAPPGVPFWHG